MSEVIKGGEGVVTTPSTGEGVVQRAAPAVALVVDTAPGAHAPPANTSTIDRGAVATETIDRSSVEVRHVAGGDSGQGPTPTTWTAAAFADGLAQPGAAETMRALLTGDDFSARTARRVVDLLGVDAARTLADGIQAQLDIMIVTPADDPARSPTLAPASVPAATGEAAGAASSSAETPAPGA